MDEGPLTSTPDAAADVAGIYATLRDRIANGASGALIVDHAVQLTLLLDSVFASSWQGSAECLGMANPLDVTAHGNREIDLAPPCDCDQRIAL